MTLRIRAKLRRNHLIDHQRKDDYVSCSLSYGGLPDTVKMNEWGV